MFEHLQIYSSKERHMVGAADLALSPLSWFRRSAPAAAPTRILLLRLERIGDLLMVLDAIAAVRATWPHAQIDLAVGSWNAALAACIPGMSTVHILDVPWLAREGTGLPWSTMVARARGWRSERYDMVLNFEPDIRSNVLAWCSGAPRRLGYWTGGGGALLTDALAYSPDTHVATNALQLVRHAAGGTLPHDMPEGRLVPDAAAQTKVDALLPSTPTRLIGVHVSGGRESKQWHLARFADTARQLAADPGATIVLTGAESDRAMVAQVLAALDGVPVINTAGALTLIETAALLTRLDVFVTGDTGPMHLAAAVGTPVVALFGPSDPRRYGPLGPRHRVLRVQLPCSPCGQVRLPPERCRGHVPDCMDGITVDVTVRATRDLLKGHA
jgi:lipopolysaccharide heptosyltransferase II